MFLCLKLGADVQRFIRGEKGFIYNLRMWRVFLWQMRVSLAGVDRFQWSLHSCVRFLTFSVRFGRIWFRVLVASYQDSKIASQPGTGIVGVALKSNAHTINPFIFHKFKLSNNARSLVTCGFIRWSWTKSLLWISSERSPRFITARHAQREHYNFTMSRLRISRETMRRWFPLCLTERKTTLVLIWQSRKWLWF